MADSDASSSPYEEGERSGFGTSLLSVLRSGAEGPTPEELAEVVSPEGDGTLSDVPSAALPRGIDGTAEKYESPEGAALDVRSGVLAAVQLLHERTGKPAPVIDGAEAAPDGATGVRGRGLGLDVARAAGAAPQVSSTPQMPVAMTGDVPATGGSDLSAGPRQGVGTAPSRELQVPGGFARVTAVEVEESAAPVSIVSRDSTPAAPPPSALEEAATRVASGRVSSEAAAAQQRAVTAKMEEGREVAESAAVREGERAAGLRMSETQSAVSEPAQGGAVAAPAGSSFRAPITQMRGEAVPVQAQPLLPEPAVGPGEGRALPPRPSSVVMEIVPEGHGEPITIRVRVFGESASARILRADPAVAQALMEGEGELVRTLEQHGFRDAQLTRSPELMVATVGRGEGTGSSHGGDRGESAGDRQRNGGSSSHQQQSRDEREQPDTFLPDFHKAMGS